MANLLMHPRADSLTFLFTTQSGYEGGREETRERGGKEKKERKKRNKMLFFLQSSCCILPTQLLWFTRCHSPGLLVSLKDSKAAVDTDKTGAKVVGDKCRLLLLMYLFGHFGLLLDVLLLNGNQCPETSLHLEDGANTHSVTSSER